MPRWRRGDRPRNRSRATGGCTHAPGFNSSQYCYFCCDEPAGSAQSALRAATQIHQERIDSLFSSISLADRNSYGAFLLAQAAAHIPTEDALAFGGVAAIVHDWSKRQRSDLIREDLAGMGLGMPQPAGVLKFQSESGLLGALYVIEGSRLGGTVLRRSVSPGLPVRFLSDGNSAAWRESLAPVRSAIRSPRCGGHRGGHGH